MKHLNNKKGYTLIEMLAVIIIIIIVGSLIAGIIVLSLRGSNRSTNVNSIRQSGNFALTQMSKMIAYAKNFEGVASTSDQTENGITYTSQCTDPDVQNTDFNFLKIQSFDQGETTYICDAGPDTQLLASYSGALSSYNPIIGNRPQISLVDTSKYSIDECYFKCQQSNISVAPTIKIHFKISTKTTGTNPNLVENNISLPFDLTVSFRNSGN